MLWKGQFIKHKCVVSHLVNDEKLEEREERMGWMERLKRILPAEMCLS